MGLFDFFSSRKDSTLISAVLSDNIAAMQRMLKSGVNPNVGDDTRPIFYALHKEPKIVQLLIDYGAEVNILDGRSGVTPLAIAEARNYKEVAKVLRAAGARIRSGNEEFFMDPVAKVSMEDKIFSLENYFRSEHPYEKNEEIADRIYNSFNQNLQFASDATPNYQKIVRQEMRIIVLRRFGIDTKDEEKKLFRIVSGIEK